VGAEYILEEKAPGKPLGRLWQDWDEWPMKDRFTTIEQIVEIERKLASTKFVKSGCIYFREDIPNSDALVTNPPLCSSILERFTLGPLVERGLWCGEKVGMDINRGPCESLSMHHDWSWSDNKQMRGHESLLKQWPRTKQNSSKPMPVHV
jgi:hypothetical protein